MLGAEIAVNGGFDAWTGNVPNGWALQNNDADHHVSNSSGKCLVTNISNVNLMIYQALGTLGKRYRVKANTSGVPAGEIDFSLNSGATNLFVTSVTPHDVDGFLISGGSYFIIFLAATISGSWIDNISVKEDLCYLP
jgi:hypothetical protein